MVDQRKRRRSRSRSRSASKCPAVELDEVQRQEAERVAVIAKRAEERAAKRASERKATEQDDEAAPTSQPKVADASVAATGERKLPLKIGEASATAEEPPAKPTFRSKAQRQKDALQKLEKKRQEVRILLFLLFLLIIIILIHYFVVFYYVNRWTSNGRRQRMLDVSSCSVNGVREGENGNAAEVPSLMETVVAMVELWPVLEIKEMLDVE